MRVLTAAQIREMDRLTDAPGVPYPQLMENAASVAAPHKLRNLAGRRKTGSLTAAALQAGNLARGVFELPPRERR